MPGTAPRASELRFDAASGLAAGQREDQQDALASDFPLGTGFGLAVLADGMGGHAAGDIAARIAVTEVFADLKLRGPGLEGAVPAALRMAAAAANRCICAHAGSHAETEGMGATLIALAFDGWRLSWLSVGDSLLWLWRGGRLTRLNEDHSLAGQIAWLVETGRMDPEVGRTHPDRHALTSCLHGGEIERIDCPELPLQLEPGDLVLVASDGIETLSDGEISGLLGSLAGARSEVVVAALLQAVAAVDDPFQDNVSLTVVQPLAGPVQMPVQLPHEAQARPEAMTPRAEPAEGTAGDARIKAQRSRGFAGMARLLGRRAEMERTRI